jgi:hypothetical protein
LAQGSSAVAPAVCRWARFPPVRVRGRVASTLRRRCPRRTSTSLRPRSTTIPGAPGKDGRPRRTGRTAVGLLCRTGRESRALLNGRYTYGSLRSSVVPRRHANNLGGWMKPTPRFPKNHWETVKIHDFPSEMIGFHGFS